MTSDPPRPWRPDGPEPWYGPPSAPGPAWRTPPHEPVLVAIGDIAVTASSVITPAGSAPLAECHFLFTDMTRTTEAIPTWAIVLAVVFAVFCLLGLLFLLAKESRTEGSVQVVVQGPRLLYTMHLPVWSPDQVADLNARVNYARSLAAIGR